MTFQTTMPSKTTSSDFTDLCGKPNSKSSKLAFSQFLTHRPVPISSSERARNVHDILDEVEQELASHNGFLSLPSLDPTPIRAEAVQVVNYVPLPVNNWQNDSSLSDLISTVLTPHQDTVKMVTPGVQIGTQLGASLNHSDLMSTLSPTDTIEGPSELSLSSSSLFPSCLPTPSSVPSNTTDVTNSLQGSSSGDDTSSGTAVGQPRFRDYQSDQWLVKYQELVQHFEKHGNCLVSWKENHHLARWIKRQRYQYKLKTQGRHSTMTDGRVKALEELGFTWDTHEASWDERFIELCAFKDFNGHCNVPSPYPENPKLGVWVKGQRRRFWQARKKGGELSPGNAERFAKLRNLGFEFAIRARKNTFD